MLPVDQAMSKGAGSLCRRSRVHLGGLGLADVCESGRAVFIFVAVNLWMNHNGYSSHAKTDQTSAPVISCRGVVIGVVVVFVLTFVLPFTPYVTFCVLFPAPPRFFFSCKCFRFAHLAYVHPYCDYCWVPRGLLHVRPSTLIKKQVKSESNRLE